MTTSPLTGADAQADGLARKLAAAERLMAAALAWHLARDPQADAEVNAALAEWQTIRGEWVQA